jgi:hypothetical protein
LPNQMGELPVPIPSRLCQPPAQAVKKNIAPVFERCSPEMAYYSRDLYENMELTINMVPKMGHARSNTHLVTLNFSVDKSPIPCYHSPCNSE